MIPWKKELVEINLGEIPTEILPATRPIPFDPSLIVKNVNNSNFIFRANFNGVVEYTSNFDYNESYGSISIYFGDYEVEVGNTMEIKKKKDDVNPNKIYTFQRTLGTAFTKSEIGDFLDDTEYAHEGYVDFNFNGTPVHLPVMLISTSAIGITVAIMNTSDQTYEIANANWSILKGAVQLGASYMSKSATQGQIINAYTIFKDIPCTVTILYHPLPD